MRRLFFSRAVVGPAPTIVSRSTFRARPGGVKLRVFMPRSQTAPGYVAGFSNSVTG